MPHSTGISWVDTLLQAREPAAPPASRASYRPDPATASRLLEHLARAPEYTPPAAASTEDFILQSQRQGGGDSLEAWRTLLRQRMENPHHLAMANAEHALFAQHAMERFGPILGRLLLGTAVPAYAGTKAIAQNAPSPIGDLLNRLTGFELTRATPPSLAQMGWGLAPAVGMMPENDSGPLAPRGTRRVP